MVISMTTQDIKDFAVKIIREELTAKHVNIKQVVLFGSNARENASPDSDWDFLVCVEKEMPFLKKVKVITAIQRRLAEMGIEVKIRVIEWAAFVNDFINRRKFDATILGWTIPMEPDLYDVWHSSKTGPQELNFISYRNDEVDALIVRARETFDQPLRKRCYDRIQEILAEEQPYMFLYVPDALPIIHARFRGVEVAPLGIGWNFIRWYVPKAEQKLVMTR